MFAVAFFVGILSHNAGVLTRVVQYGEPVPFFELLDPETVPDGSTIEPTKFVDINQNDFFFNTRLVHSLNAAGQVAFEAQVQQTAISNGFNSATSGTTGIFTAGTAGGNPVVLSGEQVSNAAEGVGVFNFDIRPVTNAAGGTAFSAYAFGPGLDQATFGIFSTGLGGLKQIALNGQQAPGVEQGVVSKLFDDRNSRLELKFNDAGHVAFVIDLDEGNENSFPSAIFCDASVSLQLIAQENDQVPGAENGTRGPALIDSFLDTTLPTISARRAPVY